MDRIEQENSAELKRRLGKRLGLAAVLIVVLLGGLAVFDYLAQLEREDASPPVAAVQPPIGPSITTGRPPEPASPQEEPITPSPSLAPLPPAEEPPPKPEVAAQPSVTPVPVPPTPPTPPAAPVPVKPVAPVAAPTPARPPTPPAPPPIAQAPAAKPLPATVPEESSSAPVLGAAAPPVRLPAPPAAGASPRPVLSRLAAGFVLQAGVFTSVERAEELKAKLVMAGVPVTIETRVQVGPFATQKEADAARKKIRDLGIESILIPPRAGRR